jgi:thiol:disulfide interchange protein
MNPRRKWLAIAALLGAIGLAGAYRIGPKIYNRARLSELQGRKIYDEKADASALFERELGRANREGKKLLVMLGGNWCQWCLALDDLMLEDAALRDQLAARFVVLKLDSQAARALDEAWGKPSTLGVPVLIFVDAKGAVKHIQETVSLELLGGRILRHDAGRVLQVLQRWS